VNYDAVSSKHANFDEVQFFKHMMMMMMMMMNE